MILRNGCNLLRHYARRLKPAATGFIILFFLFFILPVQAVEIDADSDGLPDSWEEILKTDPKNPDTDGDGYKDGVEVANGFDPLSPNPIKKEKLIKVSLNEQKLRYFFDGKQLEETLVSTGLSPKNFTPKGEFLVLRKRPVVWYKGVLNGKKYNYPNTKWNLEFKRNK